jgi:hypothetical protein
MKKPAFTSIKKYLSSANQWLLRTSERALEQAYEVAMRIKKIEDEYFGGNKISLNAEYENTVSNYFQRELRKNLRIARLRLVEFEISGSISNVSKADTTSSAVTTKINPKENTVYPKENTLDASQYTLEVRVHDKSTILLEKLKFISKVLEKYKDENSALSVLENYYSGKNPKLDENDYGPAELLDTGQDSSVYKTGIVPRSIIRTVNRFKRDLAPNSEQKTIKDLHISRIKTRISIKIILLLTIVPLLTQQLSKHFLFDPLVDHYKAPDIMEVSSNSELKEKILTELGQFEETIKFERLIGQLPNVSSEEIEAKLKEKAVELADEYKWESNEPIKNISADLLSLGAFTIIVATCRREIAVLKSLMDELAYGLSDSAKAFIIILLTDVFVGYHSPHGWEVILEKSLGHFGLPENMDFINVFIATIPVIMDTVFKYWIFRYFNQISPSAVATYKNMNE